MQLDTTSPTELPLARAAERGIRPGTGPIIIDKFVGVPKQLTPGGNAVLQGNTLRWQSTGAAPDLAITELALTDDTPLWRVISPGNVTEVSLPDPSVFGLPRWPEGPVVWLQWLAQLDQYDFNEFDYGHLESGSWRRWAFDQFQFKGPPSP